MYSTLFLAYMVHFLAAVQVSLIFLYLQKLIFRDEESEEMNDHQI